MASEFTWTTTKILDLIRMYQNYPALWDTNHGSYYKRHLKEDLWKEIASAMGTNTDKCKNKMSSLQAAFRREKAKLKKGGAESKWYAFNAMSFLLKRKAQKDNLISLMMIGDDMTSELIEYEIHDSDSSVASDGTLNSTALDNIDTSYTNHIPKQNTKDMDEIASFTNFIGIKMRKYSKTTMSNVQEAICNIIFEADRGLFDQQLKSESNEHMPSATKLFDNNGGHFKIESLEQIIE